MEIQAPPVASVGMLIRAPVNHVFAMFEDPALTSLFWFTKSSGKLEAGKHVQWEWEMYGGAPVEVNVLAVEKSKRIMLEWSAYGAPSTVEWVFTARPDDTTFVEITVSGFQGEPDQIVKNAVSSAEGFAFVLAGCKALLEHDVRLNLVPDRFPDAVVGG